MEDSRQCTLDVDNREGLVLAHTAELSCIRYEKKQLTVGDYIVRADDTILAVIERKSLTDLGASIKDGRMDNTNKLLALRARTACRVIYIIECPKGGVPTDDAKKFSNIPFGHIRSAIYHLMMRDNVMILWTVGTTARHRSLCDLRGAVRRCYNVSVMPRSCRRQTQSASQRRLI